MIHLHLHTDGSILDGSCKPSNVVKCVKEQGENAVAITDHGSMIKTFEFYQQCISNDIKPIIGCEMYLGEIETQDRFHIILLAKNNTGIKNLYKLLLKSYSNFYKKPRITFNNLIEHHEGLICTTACIGGELAHILRNKEDYSYFISKYKDLFGDDFYIEIQPNELHQQIEFNLLAQKICTEYNIKPVVTCDAHYVYKQDYYSHDTMICMQTNSKKSNSKRFKFEHNSYYLKEDKEVIDNLSYLNKEFVYDSIKNTHEIADKCNTIIETGKTYMPETVDISNPEQTLRELCTNKFYERYKEKQFDGIDINKVIKRIEYELDVICSKGYASYFLIVYDFLNYCEKNDYFYGIGRGSVCGSEVAFILGITDIEPIKYGLYFERFLNPERNSCPDKILSSYVETHNVKFRELYCLEVCLIRC